MTINNLYPAGVLRILAVFGLLAGALGCHSAANFAYGPHPVPQPAMPITPAADPLPSHEVKPSDGSLWSPEQSVNMFADDKAFRRGDILLVRVVQSSQGSKKANVDTSRKSSIAANIKYALGAEKTINKLTDYEAPEGGSGGNTSTWNPNDLINASSSNNFKGQGSTERADTLKATVSAIVTDVLSNGNLVVLGHQTVQLNNEASVLTVQGIVRPADIGEDNTVDSSRIANANIQFTGSGVLTDKQHPGWGTRVFDWVWPF